jgi:hypothetical protein
MEWFTITIERYLYFASTKQYINGSINPRAPWSFIRDALAAPGAAGMRAADQRGSGPQRPQGGPA